MNGLALTILVGQLPKLFGFSVDGDGFGRSAASSGVADGETVGAVAIGLFGLAVILGLGRWLPAPGVLIAVVLSIVAAVAFDLADRGVDLVGELPRAAASHPRGRPRRPRAVVRRRLRHRAGVAGRHHLHLAAARSGDEVDGQQEMIGIGSANLAADCSRASVSTSGSRGSRAGRRQVPGHRPGGGGRSC